MKPAFKKQLVASIVIVLAFSILNTLFRHWIFTSIGYCICGLLWIARPLPIDDFQSPKSQRLQCRIAGSLLILLGIMLRARWY